MDAMQHMYSLMIGTLLMFYRALIMNRIDQVRAHLSVGLTNIFFVRCFIWQVTPGCTSQAKQRTMYPDLSSSVDQEITRGDQSSLWVAG